MGDPIAVELVLATVEEQLLLSLNVNAAATVADVIEESGVESRFPGLDVDEMPVGIWGRLVSRESVVRPGDRIELYRPLEMDPREARRQRARAGER